MHVPCFAKVTKHEQKWVHTDRIPTIHKTPVRATRLRCQSIHFRCGNAVVEPWDHRDVRNPLWKSMFPDVSHLHHLHPSSSIQNHLDQKNISAYLQAFLNSMGNFLGNFRKFPHDSSGISKKKRLPPSMTFLVTTTGSMYWGSKPWEATAAESTDCGIAKKKRWEIIIHIMWR